MNRFWKWKNQTETEERTLFLNGTIAEDSWFDDEVTPQIFKDELNSGTGNITVYMAGDKVLMSPVSVIMIHNPLTMVCGDHKEMEKAIDMLAEVKESIINAYEYKTGLSRAKLSHLMESETWMNANKAVELGFADGISEKADNAPIADAVMFSQRAVSNALMNKLNAKYKPTVTKQAEIPKQNEHSVNEIMERLNSIEKHI